MGYTLTQKLLLSHTNLSKIKEDMLILANVDVILGNDITTPVAILELEKANLTKIQNPDNICLVLDHFTPCKDINSANLCKIVRDFAKKYSIKNFFDVGEMGIEHALLPEKGLVGYGDLIIGADSHTCTYGALSAFSIGIGSTDMAYGMVTNKVWLKVPKAYKIVLKNKPNKYVTGKDIILHLIGKIGVSGALYKSLEFVGDGVKYLSIDDRFTICNMAVECGAKNAIFEVDNITLEYLKGRFLKNFKVEFADADAKYQREIEIDLSDLKPTVAFPSLPSNTKTEDEFGNIPINQVVIGSCTNGRISDLRMAAEILKGKKVNSGVRTIIIPATNNIYLMALKEGLLQIFIESGAVVSTPTCGPCLGGHMGILAEGERAVATTNRNFVGRMGHAKSEVYLASPYIAAASAILGRLASPKDLI